jgi:transcriptional regulator with XRE-family HTH domain
MSREDLADKIMVSYSTMDNYCQGKTAPSFDSIRLLATALNVSSDYLLGLTNIEKGEISADVILDDILRSFRKVIHDKYGRTMHMLDSTNGLFKFSIEWREAMQRTEIYPRTQAVDAVITLSGNDNNSEQDIYYFNKNIHREADYIKSTEGFSKWSCDNVSIYDYLNMGRSIDHMKQAYEIERFSMGMLGVLNADEFYWLNYVLGYFKQNSQK